ncbi:protein of unknown function [Blastococcus saxobsidens DD2]|uniref:Hpr(Ser) kinase/phosphatase n=1 Tax=Blastococcus saxobsidens (strain DD2) TaxID=1146883 RepID=H6RMY7_BLASD|nr:protein of unknown function [Blastococcus saxobsidens DD2]
MGSVYGLRIQGLDAAARLMQPDDDTLPLLEVRRETTGERPHVTELDEWSAAFGLQGDSGWVRLSREPLRAQLRLDGPYNDEQVLHPFLAMTAAISNWWIGRHVLHAGAFVVDGGAWGVLGAKEAGKSSLLAQLATDGRAVLCDDLLVLDGQLAHAGPSCIDLRPGAADRFGGEPLGVVGVRERIRLRLPRSDSRAVLRGWIVPTWGSTVGVTAQPVRDRLKSVLGNYALYRGPRDPAAAISLASLPVLVLTRPKDWGAMSDASAALLRATRGFGGGG